jgi:hypothetical protein
MIITTLTATLIEALEYLFFMFVSLFIFKESLIAYRKHRIIFMLFSTLAFAMFALQYFILTLSKIGMPIYNQYELFIIIILKTAAPILIIIALYNEIIYTILQKIQTKKVITILLTIIATTIVVLTILEFLSLKLTAVIFFFKKQITFIDAHSFTLKAALLNLYCFFSLLVIAPITYYLMLRTRLKQTIMLISIAFLVLLGTLIVHAGISTYITPINIDTQSFCIFRGITTFIFELSGFYIAYLGIKKLIK